MARAYVDIETDGLDPQKNKIITIQFQELDRFKGYAKGPLKILKSWDEGQSEKSIVSQFAPLMLDPDPFRFVPVGNNLVFEFKFLAAKFKEHLSLDVDTLYFFE
ncbi:MAG: ribonuclease H-like domain-containing protein [Nitrosopumilaceae archaeon]